MLFGLAKGPQYSTNHSTSLLTLAQAAHTGTRFSDRVKRAKMMLRMFLFFRHHKKVEAIFQDYPLQKIVQANPRIYEKIYREYIFSGATMAERLQLLQSNYRFVGETFDRSWIDAIYVRRNFTLCTFPLSDGSEKVYVRLVYSGRFEKEGELTLGLYDEAGKRLYSVSFSIMASGGKATAVIGCIIGSGSGAGGNETVKRLTKGMHGMRPQNLVISLLQAFGRELGIQALLAVGQDFHVYRGSARRRDRIKFDYDQFWEEMGGTRTDDLKCFTLPLCQVRRSFEEMRSNKRALYLRRYAFLDDLEVQLQDTLRRDVPCRPELPRPLLPPAQTVYDYLIDAA